MKKNKFLYISDFIYPESLGGAEQNDKVLLDLLLDDDNEVNIRKCSYLDLKSLREFIVDCNIIVSNFVHLKDSLKEELVAWGNYVIIEHDHKYLKNRDPSPFADYQAPRQEIINKEFYKNAKAVFCQSNLHQEIMYKNLGNENIVTVGGNLWPFKTLDMLSSLNKEDKKEGICSIMHSNILHKNTKGAIRYCEDRSLQYNIIPNLPPEEFLKQLVKNQYLVFIPQTVETLSRIVVEARMAGCSVIINNKIGAKSHDWLALRGDELIEVMRGKHEWYLSKIYEIFR